MPTACLTPADLQELLFGSVAPEAWGRARKHFAECETCRLALGPLFFDEGQGKSRGDGNGARTVTASRPRASPVSDADGWMLGPYKVLGELGRGGQGQVYLAEDTRLGRKVALKVLSASFAPASSAFQRFEREAHALSRLDHPGLCAVYDAGEIDGIAYIAMRFVEGETLSKRLGAQSRVRLDPTAERARLIQATRLIERTARALHAAHEAGLVHRDIKPGNVMVTRDEEPVILDFGLARDESGDVQTLTISGAIMGTPAYMSPEHLSSSGTRLDRRTDVYSLGVTLYQCLTLHLPFEAPTREGLYQKILAGAALDPRSHNAEISRDMKVILETALEKSRERRYQTALELAEDLRRVREYEPIRACPAGPLLRFRRWTQRNPVLATATLALFVVLAVGLTISLVLLKRISFEESEKGKALGREMEQTKALETALVEKSAALARSEALRLAALGSGMVEKNPGLALLLSLEANRTQPNLLATSTVLDALGSLREKQAFIGHSVLISCLRLSPDGRYALTAAADDTARVWDISTGRQVALLYGHTNALKQARFSPDGTRIATASDDKTVRIWSFPGGRCLRVLKGHSAQILELEYSCDGRRLITGGADRDAKLWSAETGELLRTFSGHGSYVSAAMFSPDGRRVLTASRQGLARVWDADTGELLLALAPDQAQGIDGAAFHPDGRSIVTRDTSQAKLRVWNAATGAMMAELGIEGDARPCLAFSADGKLLTVSANRNSVSVIDCASWSILAELRGHQSTIETAAFNADGRRVVTASSDRTARVWDSRTGEELVRLEGHSNSVQGALFTPDGRGIISVSADATVRSWSLDGPGEVVEIGGHGGLISFAAFSPDGRRVLEVVNNSAYLHDARTGRELVALRGHINPIVAAAFSPDGSKVVTGSNGRSARIWDPATGAQLSALQGSTSGIRSVAFSRDGQRVLVTFVQGAVVLFDLAGKPVWKVELPRSAVGIAAELLPDGQRIFIASEAGAQLMNVADGGLLAQTSLKRLSVFGMQVDRGGCHALVDTWGDTVYLWSTVDCRLDAEIKGFGFGTLSSRFSPDGRRLVTAACDGLSRVWDLEAHGFVATLKGHEGRVRTVEFCPDGRQIASAGDDGAVRLWNAASGEQLCVFKGHRDFISLVSFSPDGQRILSVSNDGTCRIWPVNPVRAARRRVPRSLTPDEMDLYEVGTPELRQLRRSLQDLRRLFEDAWMVARARFPR